MGRHHLTPHTSALCPPPPRSTLGGSAANVSKSLAVLGRDLSVHFCGMVGADEASQLVVAGFASHHVVPELLTSEKSTASCVCLVS